jgi:hypothetical protein
MPGNTTRMEEQNNRDLIEFYRERLLPLAELVRERGVEIFPVGPETGKESYFVDRKAEDDYIHSIDATDLANELRAMWEDDAIPHLPELAEPLVQLANRLHQKNQDVDEVSPFIYAMF